MLPVLASTAREFTVDGPLQSFTLFGGKVIVTESIIVEWIAVVILAVVFIVLGQNLKVKPESKRQIIAEAIVTFFTDTVFSVLSEKSRKFIPYVGALFFFSFTCSILGVFGLRSPTSDLPVPLTWGLITFFLVMYTKFKTGGVKGFLKSYVSPAPFMLPFNIIGDCAAPVSISLRHFGNILAGSVISGLLYFALTGILFGAPAVGLPAVLSMYFDWFSAIIQAYIFIMLTLSYVNQGDCSE
jgi:F-type H+-transporting ATPase subunit a